MNANLYTFDYGITGDFLCTCLLVWLEKPWLSRELFQKKRCSLQDLYENFIDLLSGSASLRSLANEMQWNFIIPAKGDDFTFLFANCCDAVKVNFRSISSCLSEATSRTLPYWTQKSLEKITVKFAWFDSARLALEVNRDDVTHPPSIRGVTFVHFPWHNLRYDD